MWLLDGALNFTPYAFLPVVLPVLVAMPFQRRKWTLLACAPLLAWAGLLGTSGLLVARAEGCGERPVLRVVTANVLMSNRQLPALADDVLAQAPDIVVFEELQQSLEAFSPRLAAAYPYRISTTTPWVTLASRLPLEAPRRISLEDAADPARDPLAAQVQVNGQPITLLAIHATVPRNELSAVLHGEQYNLLAREAEHGGGRVLAIGDFNATLLSPVFARFLLHTGLRSASADGVQQPTHVPYKGLGLRIDHVLLRGLDVCGEHVFTLTGSDHRGVAVEVGMPPA